MHKIIISSDNVLRIRKTSFGVNIILLFLNSYFSILKALSSVFNKYAAATFTNQNVRNSDVNGMMKVIWRGIGVVKLYKNN